MFGYASIDPTLINYSSLYYPPSALGGMTDPIVPYANALVTGQNPTAYINSPTLPGNRYFLDTQTKCTYAGDPSGVTHDRSVLVDNVLQSSVGNLGKASSSTGLMYSLAASLNQLISAIPNLSGPSAYTPYVPLPVQFGSTPVGSTSPNVATSYLMDPPVFPPCVPVSVYIDGTNTLNAKGWVSPSDYSAIDPAAIESFQGGFQESFQEGIDVTTVPELDPSKLTDTNYLKDRANKIKTVSKTAVKKTNDKLISVQKSRYMNQYNSTDPTKRMDILTLFTTFANYQQGSALSSNPSSDAPIIPFSTVKKVFDDPALFGQLTNPDAQTFIQTLQQTNNANDFVTAVNTLSAEVKALSPEVNALAEGQQNTEKIEEKKIRYNALLADLEVYRILPNSKPRYLPIIDAIYAFDQTATQSSGTDGFQTQYSNTGALHPAMYDTPNLINHFYIAGLIFLGLYMFYCIYKKHGLR